jgi:hypothetical protein
MFRRCRTGNLRRGSGEGKERATVWRFISGIGAPFREGLACRSTSEPSLGQNQRGSTIWLTEKKERRKEEGGKEKLESEYSLGSTLRLAIVDYHYLIGQISLQLGLGTGILSATEASLHYYRYIHPGPEYDATISY